MIFLMSLPSVNLVTAGFARARPSASSWEASGASSMVARTLPLTWTATVAVASTQRASSQSTQGSCARLWVKTVAAAAETECDEKS